MRFTVLGKSPAWEDAGGACSGYLVEAGEHTAVIDCGNGAFSKLRERIAYETVDQVLISHIHADHVLDLVPFAYALTLGGRSGERRRPELLLPPGGLGQLRSLVAIWGSDGLIDDAFEPREYELEAELRIGPLHARLTQVPHFALTHAVGLETESGARLVYGADCRAGPELEKAAAGAEILLAEATLPEPEPDSVPIEERGHMSAAEAGRLAASAGVGRLVLTHISDQLDYDEARAAAAAEFSGPVEVAAMGAGWEL